MLLAPDVSRDVERLSKTLATTVSDFGVEAAVVQMGPVRLREVVPWFQVGVDEEAPEPHEPQPHELQEDDFSDDDLPDLVEVELPPLDPMNCFLPPAGPHAEDEFADLPGLVDAPAPPPPADPMTDLSACSDVPGLLHIVHNAGRGLEDQLQHYTEATKRLQVVSKLLRRNETSTRLKTTCFNSAIGEHLWTSSGLDKFSGKCYSDRWGTVACCVVQVTSDMERALEHAWSLEKYRFGRTDPVREEDSDHSSQIGLVDDTLSAAYWWCYWKMLKSVAKVLKEALEWAEVAFAMTSFDVRFTVVTLMRAKEVEGGATWRPFSKIVCSAR